MNIGDKVRLLRGTEEGVVVRLLQGNLVEIEIEDGFTFPVLRSEVVVVHKSESDHFKKAAGESDEQRQTIKSPTVQAEKGIYLAFEPKGERYDLLLINNTDYELVYKVDELYKGSTIGLNAGHLLPKNFIQVGSRSLSSFDTWPDLHFSFIYFQAGVYKQLPALYKKLSFHASSFATRKSKIPFTNSEGPLFQLDEVVPSINAEQLREKMLTPKEAVHESLKQLSGKSVEVDLHLEKLVDKSESLKSPQALSYQLAIFEKELDKAIANGLDEITFIHGVGNGVLKEEIQKRLSKMKNISYFQDARKERFGYGATLVKIRD